MIKVFISHQSADTMAASYVARRLKYHHEIDSYLDAIAPYIGRPGEDLAIHIRTQMEKCTQLLAVVSEATKASQWVPWEIGVATEKDYPLATYAASNTLPPEFLRKWPYMRTDAHLDQYAAASKVAQNILIRKRSANLQERVARRSSTREFYATIRRGLGQ